jgi:hypothetical protein
MSTLGIKKILIDCADALRALTHTADLVPCGDLANRIQNIQNVMLLRDFTVNGLPKTVDLSHWTPANFGASYRSSGLTTSCIPVFAFTTGQTFLAMYGAVIRIICPQIITGIGASAFNGAYTLEYHPETFSLQNVEVIGGSAFAGCIGLRIGQNNINPLVLPHIQAIYNSAFGGAIADYNTIVYGSVQLGSSGYAVTMIGTNAFQNQSNITSITIYTVNGLASDLTSAPWGAANATINYIKA